MHVLVTGGAGFIGSHVVDALLARGDRVTVLDDLTTGDKANLAHVEAAAPLELVIGSITDPFLVDRLVMQADALIHLAAAVGVQYIMQRQVQGIITNTVGTEHVLRAAAQRRIPTFLASSSEVYGKSPEVPATETSYPVIGTTDIHRWSYACTKALDEFLALAYHREQGLPVVIGRFFNVTGPRQSPAYGMVLPRFCRAALAGEDLRVYGDGEQTRTFLHVGDCVCAVLAVLAESRAHGQVVNIGGAEPVSMRGLAELVCRRSGSSAGIELVPYERAYPSGNFEDIRHRVPAIDKIRELCDWRPGHGLEDIVDATLAASRLP
ncbi:MAG: NAD-dependent epimerase/dehydratase family protein [Planctomycetota bacterium]